jgi:hypothetical protein
MKKELTKIQQLIQEQGIKPSECVYHTWRDIENGEIRVLVLHDRVARSEFICPGCRKYGYVEKPWSRPFSVKCPHCEKRIPVPKMKRK